MKAFILVLLIVVLVSQTTSAFPQLRYRRDAQQHVKLSPDGENKRTELKKYFIEEMMTMVKNALDIHKKIYENILKNADEADLKIDSLKEQFKNFTEFVDKINKLPTKPESFDDLLTLTELFNDSLELLEKYDDIENLTEQEKLFKRLLVENGAQKLLFKYFIDVVKLHIKYESRIQKYVDSLSDEDKTKEGKFLEWFEKFKNVENFDQYVDMTMEVFNLFDDEDGEFYVFDVSGDEVP